MKTRMNAAMMNRCAFCEYWYTANRYITPIRAMKNFYELETNAESICTEGGRNLKRQASMCCSKFKRRGSL